MEVQWLPGACSLLTITGAQDTKEDYASTFLVSTLSHGLTFHWQSKLHGQFQHPCGGEIILVHCSALEDHMTDEGVIHFTSGSHRVLG